MLETPLDPSHELPKFPDEPLLPLPQEELEANYKDAPISQAQHPRVKLPRVEPPSHFPPPLSHHYSWMFWLLIACAFLALAAVGVTGYMVGVNQNTLLQTEQATPTPRSQS